MDGENQAFVYYWLPGLYYQHAGTTIQRRISKKFDSYQSVWTKQKLHLVLNQTKFSPGDTVWFKAYLLGEDQKNSRTTARESPFS